MRAESGSKSKWSGSAAVYYLGSSLATPLGNERPNTYNDPTPPPVALAGSVSLRYRMSKNHSLQFGTGYGFDSPWKEAKSNVSDPYLEYNFVGNLSGVQNIFQVQGTYITDNTYRSWGMLGQADVTNISMYDFGGSRWTLGLILSATARTFEGGNAALQRDYEFGAAVPVEYAINDTVQLRTVFRPWSAIHNKEKETFTFRSRRWTQSFGVAVAVTRDINLYPNFQWDWEQWRGNNFNFFSKAVRENSTVGLQAAINVF